MEQGWDPEVKKYFKKVLFSICYGLFWLMTMAALGIYYGFADAGDKPVIYTIFFYIVMVLTLGLLVRYYYNTWKK